MGRGQVHGDRPSIWDDALLWVIWHCDIALHLPVVVYWKRRIVVLTREAEYLYSMLASVGVAAALIVNWADDSAVA